MRIAVNQLRPNPFRDLKHYPINTEKVDALVQSIKSTEFWDNLIARKSSDGHYELAYGVHRLKALTKAGVTEVDIPVRNLDDDTMIKIMVHENQVEWSSNALIDQESIRAVVLAFGDALIELSKPARNTPEGQLRYAPSFQPGVHVRKTSDAEYPYTITTLSNYLGGDKAGWSEGKVKAILATLATMAQGLIDREDLEGLSTYQAEQAARQASRVVNETGDEKLAKSIGKRLAGGMRSSTGRPPGRGGKPKGTGQSYTYHGAKHAADEMMGSARRKQVPKKMPPIEKFAEQLCVAIGQVFPSLVMKDKLDSIIEYRDELPAKNRKAVVSSLRNLAKRATEIADKLEG